MIKGILFQNLRGNILQKISFLKFFYKKPPQLVLHVLCLLIMTDWVSKKVSLILLKIRAAINGNQGGDGPPLDPEKKVGSLQVFEILSW